MAEIALGVRYYTKEHEWIELIDGFCRIGISEHAQEALGELVYAGEMPEPGDDVAVGDVVGVVESVKATSDVFSPVGGAVVEINEALEDNPETINEDAEGAGWILKIKLQTMPDSDDFMDAGAYAKFSAEQG